MKYESIGRHIQQERKAHKMMQSVLAEKTSVSTKYISNIECGEKLPRLETFIAIANAIGTDANTLLSDVLEVSAEIKSSPISEKIAGLPPAEQKRILRLLNAMVDEAQELARNSFGFAMAGDVFSTMIRLYARHLDFLKQQVREMDRKIAEIMKTLDTPITTITGIGPTLGAYILSEIGDISRFSSAAKLAAYAGIDPTMRQSGEYNGVRNRMSKRGSPYLRHAIWLAASSAVLHDPALKLYFQKKRDEGKPYMASVGHACRKMVSIIYAVMRDNKAYTPYIPNEISA